MKIIIKNEKKLTMFYKFIPLYKSFIFKFVKFELNENLFEKEPIVEALNIKNRKKRIAFIYDFVCDIIDESYYGKNICGFENNKCYAQREPYNDKCNGCCRLCLYQNPKGCKTKNLSCKFYFCSDVIKRQSILKFEDFMILKCLTFRQRILLKHNYFSKREEILNDLYINSLIVGAIRIIYRNIRNLVIFKKRKI
jgi:hypothetical protein